MNREDFSSLCTYALIIFLYFVCIHLYSKRRKDYNRFSEMIGLNLKSLIRVVLHIFENSRELKDDRKSCHGVS